MPDRALAILHSSMDPPTSVETVLAVHHRQPGVASFDLLVTLCPACHAIVERTEVLFRDVRNSSACFAGALTVRTRNAFLQSGAHS